jgi:hypothetical protein
MDKNTYVAISSDSRDLYKADIYKILSKPVGAVEHFRYQDQWIKDDICKNFSLLNGAKVILVYKLSSDNIPIEYIPIRVATIVGYDYDADTEVYHYYFQLGRFCKIESPVVYTENIFFQNSIGLITANVSWKSVINLVAKSFKDDFFYKVDGIKTSSGKPLCLKRDPVNHSYFYIFHHGSEYTLELTVANPNLSKRSLIIESSSSDINIVMTKKYFISAPFDKLRIPITTKSLDSFKEKSFISFYIHAEEEIVKDYENHIHIFKKMYPWRPILFGVLSSVLIASTWLLKDKTTSIENVFTWQLSVDWLCFFYVISILSSSAFLFALFNKK